MLLLPDDYRQSDEELMAKFAAAKVRVYQYSLELCHDLRALVEEAGTDDVVNARDYAEKVSFATFRESGTRDVDLRIDIEIADASTTAKTKSGTLIRREGQWMALDAGVVHKVVGMVSRPLREALADVLLPPMMQSFLDDLEEEGEYGEMEELREKFGILYDNIVAGTWPKRRLPRNSRGGGYGSL